ncbi:MAG TPA: VOC family protein, partial [Acidobacteriota bacterium]|nr:VOC family protein [Acidobacteriota bacterium]
MAKRSRFEQLDQAVQAYLVQSKTIPSADASVTPLLEIAETLCDFPAGRFRAQLKAELQRRAIMITTVRTVATPRLICRNAAAAIEFYKDAFGATEVFRFVEPNGRVGHAELRIGDAAVYLTDEAPEYGTRSPLSLGGSPVEIHLDVEDVDAFTNRAVAAGAKLVRPVQDQFHGHRLGQIADPFGHEWKISTPVEDVSKEEMNRRFRAM